MRQRVVEPDGRMEHVEGRGVIIRHGLARWAQLQCPSSTASLSAPEQRSAHSQSEKLAPGMEIVKLVAGLILSSRKESICA
ncbi:MAG TPA: hypothetical protein VE135_23485 [Pyrinomonadaceae bacterium]|nr:hypothetical protein [Pyrinomonadaceae bacterium]